MTPTIQTTLNTNTYLLPVQAHHLFRKLKEVVEYAPLEQLVLETDSPYLSPEPNRGKRNSSLNLPYVAAMIAELKGISGEEVIAVTEENAKRLLFRK